MKKFGIISLICTMVLVAMLPMTAFAADGVTVQFFNGNTASSTNTLYANFKLVNTGTTALTLSNIKMRYYFTNDGTQSNSFACDYSTIGSANATGTFGTVSATTADKYLEVGFTSAAGSLAAGASVEVKSRIWKSDWSNFTQTNDYSFNASATNYVDSTVVTGYINGILAWGTEAGGSVATPTPTPTSSVTSTPTPPTTNTSTPTPTPTITPTPTPAITPTPTPTTVAKFHCFLLLGQSNMAGYAKSQASDKVEDPRVLVLGYDNNSALGRVTDQWDVACPPLHAAWLDAIGPGDWFGKTMIQKVPAGDTIGLIPCAISGEKIETFMKVGGTKYSWIINRAKLAQQKGGVIEGIIFHQGESNSGDTSWPGKVKTLVTDLRNDLNLGNVPFLPGELLYSGPCAGHNTLVNQLPSLITNCYVISASGLVVDPSDTTYRLHFGHDSSVELGKRYAAKMIQVLGW